MPVSGCHPQILVSKKLSDGMNTSHVEQENLSIRMEMRRMTRLTNALGKKGGNPRTRPYAPKQRQQPANLPINSSYRAQLHR